MEGGGGSSEGEMKQPPEGGKPKVKRKMKTAAEVEVLEKAYQEENYPSETMRAELSAQLGLADRQVQQWFRRRRLKDKKEWPAKRQRKGDGASPADGTPLPSVPPSAAPALARVLDEEFTIELVNEHGADSGSSPHRYMDRQRTGVYRCYETPQSIMEYRAIMSIEAQLGEPLREDGPALGVEFDPLPPGAFGSPIDAPETPQEQHRQAYERNLYAQSDAKLIKGKRGHLLPSTSGEHDDITCKSPNLSVAVYSSFSDHPNLGLDNAFISSKSCPILVKDVARVEPKKKSEDTIIRRDAEAHEKRMQKQLEKQENMRRKQEEQLRKEMERHDRERLKEEKRLLREKQRVERYQREQRQEIERRERFLLNESIKAEKMRQKEEKEAARQKAANDRAARRIAKESMKLIEDERLELMELAVSTKALPSILSLDSETLENLDSFRDLLEAFPPKSVQLKRPFAAQPWIDSDENVGNLLMVWRFLITFADVLGLWPFTVDEFVQAFHDYEPRLMGEIHIALLKLIVKDIEDVARILLVGPRGNHNSAANPGGGHPRLVEGAYAWGFDIRSWQDHLSPITWPEILRQLALSAGFGPKLKKKNIEPAYMCDDDEGDNGADVISNLRTGAAAGNAAAMMQEKGYGNSRRSRHRLTPGTVKFAAYYVLSLEGRNGLNILEVADRIQKSGLRDLTTSKTPEASVAAALSRDTKLFERVAPSTYCVRTPYRKDPVDADAILSAAREKIREFQSGFVNGVEADDVEKNDSSGSDTAEDPEIGDVGAVLTGNKAADPSFGVNRYEATPSLGNGFRIGHDAVYENPANGLEMDDRGLSLMQSEDFQELRSAGDSVEQSMYFGRIYMEENSMDQEDNDIDESYTGESWVQGLVEGEYSDLSVEERLAALVALIGVVIEGNTIWVVTEERLEAANAMKKQMLMEAQADKRRMKEEYSTKTQYTTTGSRSEPMTVAKTENILISIHAEGKMDDALGNAMVQQMPLRDSQIDQNFQSDLPSEKNCVSPDNLDFQQSAYAAERSHAHIKSYISDKAEEMYVYRSLPLGLDRRCNRYWQFMASASSNDPGSGRIFVELCNGGWRLIDSAEVFDALLASLDVRGVRECHLHTLLQKIEPLFKETLKWKLFGSTTGKQRGDSIQREASEASASFHPHGYGCRDSPNSTICALDSNSPEPSLSFHIECGKNKLDLANTMKRYKDSVEWMWKECLSPSMLCATKYGKKRCTQLLDICNHCHDVYFFEDKHCPMCHITYTSLEEKLNFSQHVSQCEETKKFNPDWRLPAALHHNSPMRIRLLKSLLALVEVSIPSEALQLVWSDMYRRSWGKTLQMAASADEILQVLSLLEGAVKRDFLSWNFQTTNELVASIKASGSTSFTFDLGSTTVLPWVPQTTAAVSLRLIELDSALSYLLDQKAVSERDSEAVDLINLQSKHAVVRNIQEDELAGPNAEHLQEDTWMDPEGGHMSLGRARAGRERASGSCRGRTRGGKSQSQRRVTGSRTEPGRRKIASTSERLGQVLGGWKGCHRERSGGKRRRSVRNRQKPVMKVPPAVSGQRQILQPINSDRSTGIYGRDDQMQIEDAVNDSDSDRSGYGDDNDAQETGYYNGIATKKHHSAHDGWLANIAHEDGEDDEEEDDDEFENNGDDYREDNGGNYSKDMRDEYEDGVDVNGGDYEEGDLEIDGYFHADSNGVLDDGNGKEDDDDSGSSSTDYSE